MQRICLQCRRPRFDPWVRKRPWRNEWLSTTLFFLENSMDRGAWRAQSMGSQELDIELRYFKSQKMILLKCCTQFHSVQLLSHVDSLRPHGLQHARPACPLLTPGVYSNSCPLSQWYHPNISSVIPFSSCLQSCPASGSFQMSHQVAKVLKFQLQHQSFQWIFRTDFL